MSLAHAWAVALIGIEGHLVEVEADLAPGLPGLALVGLPDAALSEARDRVRAAVSNSGLAWPSQRITVGLSPAALPKAGSAFDAAIAAAVLAANGEVPIDAVATRVLLGELALDGRLRATRGILPAVLAAARAGHERVVVPVGNAREAALVPGVQVTAVESLSQLVDVLRGDDPGAPVPRIDDEPAPSGPDLVDVLGQDLGRLALETAAAGGHHLFLHGPPGAGKTMLAARLPGLLPPLTDEQALEVSAVHSVAGLLADDSPLVRHPPFRAPHHSATLPALVGGGGGRQLRPGAVSLAHRGVLFLDEAPEFRGGVLDALRQPLESGVVEIARSSGTARFPARVQLVLAANPCPCASSSQSCICGSLARRRYLGRISGALLDRVDLRVEVFPVDRVALLGGSSHVEGTADVAARVHAARAAGAERWSGTPWRTNTDVPGSALRGRWRLAPADTRLLAHELDRGRLTARGYDRVLRVAWTLESQM
jgi:magnesium chelatase family protein